MFSTYLFCPFNGWPTHLFFVSVPLYYTALACVLLLLQLLSARKVTVPMGCCQSQAAGPAGQVRPKGPSPAAPVAKIYQDQEPAEDESASWQEQERPPAHRSGQAGYAAASSTAAQTHSYTEQRTKSAPGYKCKDWDAARPPEALGSSADKTEGGGAKQTKNQEQETGTRDEDEDEAENSGFPAGVASSGASNASRPDPEPAGDEEKPAAAQSSSTETDSDEKDIAPATAADHEKIVHPAASVSSTSMDFEGFSTNENEAVLQWIPDRILKLYDAEVCKALLETFLDVTLTTSATPSSTVMKVSEETAAGAGAPGTKKTLYMNTAAELHEFLESIDFQNEASSGGIEMEITEEDCARYMRKRHPWSRIKSKNRYPKSGESKSQGGEDEVDREVALASSGAPEGEAETAPSNDEHQPQERPRPVAEQAREGAAPRPQIPALVFYAEKYRYPQGSAPREVRDDEAIPRKDTESLTVRRGQSIQEEKVDVASATDSHSDGINNDQLQHSSHSQLRRIHFLEALSLVCRIQAIGRFPRSAEEGREFLVDPAFVQSVVEPETGKIHAALLATGVSEAERQRRKAAAMEALLPPLTAQVLSYFVLLVLDG